MANKVSLYQKWKLFRSFKKSLKRNKVELEQTLGARVDNAYRIYNVLNIPQDMIGEPYNLRKADIDKFAETEVKNYSTRLAEFLNNKELNELYDFYEVKKVDKYSYLVVVGFSLFRSNEYYDMIRWRILPITSLLIIILSLILFL